MEEKFGNLTSTPSNIGEEIQQLASLRFLPDVDYLIHRDRIDEFRAESKVKLLMNAWWTWDWRHFPPSDCIEPLLISMFFRLKIRKKILTQKVRNYLKKYSPVGCRDKSTTEWLEQNGIPAYFSGCLTLTLVPNDNITRQDYILCVDMPQKVVECISKRTNRKVYNIPVEINPLLDRKKRMEIAQIYLRLYQEAGCVVSNRLHAILPALAFETPVLKVDTQENERDINDRFSGYEGFVHACSIAELLENENIYDFNNPPKNPDNYVEMRNDLVNRCKAFTGYDSELSFVDTSENPLIELLSVSEYQYEQIERSLYWSKMSDLIKTYLKRLVLRKNKFDKQLEIKKCGDK